MVDRDVLALDATAFGFADEVGCEKDVHELAGESGSAGSADQELHFPGGVTGFLEQLAAGGRFQGLAEVLGFVTDQTGGNLDDPAVGGDAHLLDEDDFVFRSDRQDADRERRVRAADEVPFAIPADLNPLGFKQGLGVSHGLARKKRWRRDVFGA